MMEFDSEIFGDELYDDASILFDEVAEVVKSPLIRNLMLKALKGAVVLTVISFGKQGYKYMKNGGWDELKRVADKVLKHRIT